MATVAELEKWQKNLQEALYSGALTVRDSDGSSITYQSSSDLRAALRRLEYELAEMTRNGVCRITYPITSKGLTP